MEQDLPKVNVKSQSYLPAMVKHHFMRDMMCIITSSASKSAFTRYYLSVFPPQKILKHLF